MTRPGCPAALSDCIMRKIPGIFAKQLAYQELSCLVCKFYYIFMYIFFMKILTLLNKMRGLAWVLATSTGGKYGFSQPNPE